MYQLHELKAVDACKKRRVFTFETQEHMGEHTQKARVIKTVIRDCITGAMKKEDIQKRLDEEFKNFSYPSEEQRRLHTADAERQIRRYISSETRRLYLGQTKTVSIGNGVDVLVKPDFIYYNKDEAVIEVIKIQCKKPDITQKTAGTDLGLYALLKYAQTLVQKGEFKHLCASYYYLRKANDSSSLENPKFDEDFFNNTGGRNIVSLNDRYKNAPGEVMDMDAHFGPLVKKFAEGLPEEECSEEDCKKCPLFSVCKYTEAPKAIEKETVHKRLKDMVLTDEQVEVVDYESGILRVNAGAGAGKTMVVALRTGALIEKGYDPKKMLLITFTNAGAEEMRSRIEKVLEDVGIDKDISDMTICTFNAFGDMILKKEYAKLGFNEPPKVIDDVERSRIIANLLNTHTVPGLDYRNFTTNMKTCKGALAVAKDVFAIVKAGQYSVSDAPEVMSKMSGYSGVRRHAVEELIALYDEYDEMLRNDNLIEFADQEVLVFELLHQNPFYLEKFGFEHITIDEFQDTSEGQLKLVKHLINCPSFKSLMVIGDDSQAIFGFRDTTPKFILEFPEYIQQEVGMEVDDIFLRENHRSTPEILDCANKLNDMRKDKIPKDLVATRAPGKPVVVKGFLNKQDEYNFILKDIKEHLDAGIKPEDIAIIAATKYELMSFADMLGKAEIPSVLLNPEPLLENSRVQAAVALSKFLRDAEDTSDMLVYANALAGGGLIEAPNEEIEEKIEALKKETESYQALTDEQSRKEKIMSMLWDIDSNEDEVYESLLKTLEVKNVDKLMQYLDDFYLFGSAAAFRRTHSYPGVVLTTAHSSKGLEWNVVYNTVSKYDGPELHTNSSVSREMMEERLRLLFVSMTRARDELIITGQFVAYGKRGDYKFNEFLNDSMKCAGGHGFTEVEVQRLMRERDDLRKIERQAQKRAREMAEPSPFADAV